MSIYFSVEDLRTPEGIERVFQQVKVALQKPIVPKGPDLNSLVKALAPQLRDQLQAGGVAPLNLQSLLPVSGNTQILQDTHANRLINYSPANLPVGTIFFETDRTVYYIVTVVSGSQVWQCLPGGYMKGTIASPDQKPTDLGTNDTRFEFYSTEFNKYFRWTGSAWERRGDQLQAGFIQLAAVGPAIGIPGWQLCDGSTVAASRDDGTTNNVTVPDYTTAAYVKVASVASVGPFGATGVTDDEASHTHNFGASAVTGDDLGSGVEVQAGTGVVVAEHFHAHGVSFGTAPTSSGTPHHHGPGTLELRNTQLRAYYRL